jgi:peptidyl-prolyl cis-trans isomerase D
MAVLSNIRQRSALMIAVIAFALFAFIIDLFSSGGFSSTSRCRKHQWKDISFEDFRIKVSKKVIKELLNSCSKQSVGPRGFCSFVNSEFDKLGLRVGENIY